MPSTAADMPPDIDDGQALHLPAAGDEERTASRTGSHSRVMVLLLAASTGLERADEHLTAAVAAAGVTQVPADDHDLGEHTVQ